MSIQNLSEIGKLRLNHDIALKSGVKPSGTTSFSDVLTKELNGSGVQFSKHAIQRMNERGLDFTEELKSGLEGAIEKAREKGAKDVVVIGTESAFVVNVPNNLVITTMNALEMREKIFTNIDGAVIM